MPLTSPLAAISENRVLDAWGRALRRRPDQLNAMHEADAELVPLPGTGRVLALTTDTLAEEIALGFYRDPETIGWMAATVSLSDLAAVGAEPLGVLAAVTLPRDAAPDFQAGVAAGLDGACRAAGTFVLGGDTNLGEETSVTTTAAGLADRSRLVRRVGCGPGEVVYASGRLGAGAVVAALAAAPEAVPAVVAEFRPRARVREGRWLPSFATACMDTSDGLLATLDQLSRLNGVGFEITMPLHLLVEPAARQVCRALEVDDLVALAQPHGEFELVWTVRERERHAFERHAEAHGLAPLALGRTIAEPVICVAGEYPRMLDTAWIRNLADELGNDPARYLAALAAAMPARPSPRREAAVAVPR